MWRHADDADGANFLWKMSLYHENPWLDSWNERRDDEKSNKLDCFVPWASQLESLTVVMCQSAPVIVSVATEVQASCENVWNVISDIELAPNVITTVVSVARLSDGKEGFQIGTRWKEIRLYDGHEVTQIKTVTSIRKENSVYSAAINVSYPGAFQDVTNTSTLEIRPLNGVKNKCLLIGSFGVMPGTLKSRIYFCLCSRQIAKRGETSYLVELEEIGNAAEQSQIDWSEPLDKWDGKVISRWGFVRASPSWEWIARGAVLWTWWILGKGSFLL